MPKKKDESSEIQEIPAPITSISPIFSNISAVFTTEETVMLDFGYVVPSYQEPNDLMDIQVSRICMPWSSAESLRKILSDAISDHKKELKNKQKRRENK